MTSDDQPSPRNSGLSRQLREQCIERFERAWLAGERPALAAYLPAEADRRRAVLGELVHADLEFRLKAGELVRVETYLHDYPELAGEAATVLSLIAAEYELRRRQEPGLDPVGYLERFPAYREQLAQRLQAAERGDEAPTTGTETVDDRPRVDAESVREPAPAAPGEEKRGSGVELPAIPGYEVLAVLGQGGMGVVYKARHTALKRIVALKMIKGAHVDTDDLQRFRTEAEAVARLQHPNIVQIFEVGEYRGSPYLALEYAEGGSLDRKLNGLPRSPKQAAEIVRTLALALQHAHEQGIIHRDLKPANVLVGANWTLKVTDFGLARRVDASLQTATGAIVGTPSYMAPEQAAGDPKAIGPRADVYALGAILYEALTGRPPFKAATPLDTVLQVLSEEPVPPTRLQSKTPRDLETICLKCLHKEPAKRYASPAALAEDLRRFKAGEPIAARPVGRVERLVKWARRYPARAAALAAMVLAVITLGVATTLLTAANERERKAKEDVEKANVDLKRSRDEALDIAARSLVRPFTAENSAYISFVDLGGEDLWLTPPEIEALWELAGTNSRELRVRFVEQATREPQTSRQLQDRAAFALHAAVGLDLDRRARVEEVLRKRLKEQGLSEAQRTDLGLVAAGLGDLAPETAAVVGEILAEASSKPIYRPLRWFRLLPQALKSVSGRLNAGQASKVVDALLAAMFSTKDPHTLWALADGVKALSGRLDEAAAGKAAEALIAATAKTNDRYATSTHLYQALQALSSRLNAAQARKVADAILVAIPRTNNRDANIAVVWELNAVSRWLDAAQASKMADTLLAAMRTTKERDNLPFLAGGLAAVSERLDAAQAGKVVDALLDFLVKTDEWDLLPFLENVSERLDGTRVGKVADALLGVIAKSPQRFSPDKRYEAANRLRARSRWDTAEAARQARRVADTLIADLLKPAEPFRAVEELQAVSGALETTRAGEVADALVAAMLKSARRDELPTLASGVIAVSGRLDAVRAEKAAEALIAAMGKTIDWEPLELLAKALEMVSRCLENAEASRLAGKAADAQLDAMRKTTDARILFSRARALKALSRRLDVAAAAARAGEAADTLLAAMRGSNNPDVLYLIVDGLVTLSGQFDTTRVARVADALLAAMPKTNDRSSAFFDILMRGVKAVSGRLDATQASKVANVLLATMCNTKELYGLNAPAGALMEVSDRLAPDSRAALAGKAADILLDAMHSSKYKPFAVVGALEAVSQRLDAGRTSKVVDALLQAMPKTTKDGSRYYLIPELMAVSNRLDATQARKVADALLATLHRTDDPDTLLTLANGLHKMSGRLNTAEVSTLAHRVADALLNAIRNAKDDTVVSSQARTLEAVSRGLDTASASKLAHVLLEDLAKMEYRRRRWLRSCFVAVLIPQDSDELRRRTPTVAGIVGALASPDCTLALSGLLQPAMKPLPRPLPAQSLIDLLKHPCCVGPARRAVLDQLQRHYDRPFADQWDFVHFAQERQLGLDLISPPQRQRSGPMRGGR